MRGTHARRHTHTTTQTRTDSLTKDFAQASLPVAETRTLRCFFLRLWVRSMATRTGLQPEEEGVVLLEPLFYSQVLCGAIFFFQTVCSTSSSLQSAPALPAVIPSTLSPSRTSQHYLSPRLSLSQHLRYLVHSDNFLSVLRMPPPTLLLCCDLC